MDEPRNGDEQDLLEAVEEVQAAQREQAAAAERLAKVKHQLCELLTSRGLTTEVVTDEAGKSYRATVVSSERTKVDGEGLKAAIGARAWNKLTTRSVNPELLTKAMIDGRLDPTVVSPFITITTTSAFPKITPL